MSGTVLQFRYSGTLLQFRFSGVVAWYSGLVGPVQSSDSDFRCRFQEQWSGTVAWYSGPEKWSGRSGTESGMGQL